jgi:Skp family chaperone for outer membrane proteins
MNLKTLLALFLCLCAAAPAAAIELSLEENKAERGNIGYIDMQRLFRTFPETIRARENFEELVRQAEEQLNLRKAEILRTRSELSELKIEREFMAKTPIEINRPGEKSTAAEAPKGAAAIAAAAEAAARERRETTENPDLAKVAPPKPTTSAEAPAAPTAPSQAAPAPAAPAPAAPEATAPVPPQAAPAPAPAPSAEAPAAGAGRRGAEPETDLTRPSIANLPGFAAPAPSTSPATPAIPGYATPQQFAGAPAASTAPAAPATPPAAPTSDENMREALEQSRRAAEAKKREPLVINIPGVSTAPIVVQPPEAPAPAPAAAEKPAAATPPAGLPVPSAPAATAAAGTPAPSNLNPALVELDARIAVKQKELDSKELAYKSEQSNSEKNLLDLESRKTEILLGKIHRAVQEVAHREGVSVVVDKSSILYGHDAVDLTDKVMKYLRGS